MNFDYSDKTQQLIDRLQAFMDENIYPVEKAYTDEVHANSANEETRWVTPAVMEDLKQKAKDAGLWNLFLPEDYLPYGAGLTNLEYAPLCEIMGRVLWSSKYLIAALLIPVIWKSWPDMVLSKTRKST